MKCPQCGHAMNHHANKLLMDSFAINEDYREQALVAFSCPHCGFNAAREAAQEVAQSE